MDLHSLARQHTHQQPLPVAVVVLCLLLACSPVAADERGDCRAASRQHDQLWLVSNRGVGCAAHGSTPQLAYWRYDRATGWVRANLDELLAADDGNLQTTVFVHGNRISRDEAFTKGWSAYRTLVRGANERPLRFIIWSWPSQAVKGPLVDARIKARRADLAAYDLAWLVDKLSPDQPVSLWGHSFGARVITGALHLLAGGALDGYRLGERAHASRQPLHVVLIAAALDHDWLRFGGRHGLALSQADRVLLINNSSDALLKRYHWIYHRKAWQRALGYVGLARGTTVAENARIEQLDARGYVGRQHVLANYLCSPGLVARMRGTLLWPASSDRGGLEEALASVQAAEDHLE